MITEVIARVKIVRVGISKEFKQKIEVNNNLVELPITNRATILIDKSDLLKALDDTKLIEKEKGS